MGVGQGGGAGGMGGRVGGGGGGGSSVARGGGGDVSRNSCGMPFGRPGRRGEMRGGGFGSGQHGQGEHASGPARATKRAVVFVVGEGGSIEPRMVMIGLTDWDRTEVVSGLEEGDRVALIGLAQLQIQREEFLERMRGRGAIPWGGGRRGGMRG